MQSSSVVLPPVDSRGRRGRVVCFDHYLGLALEYFTAALVLAEIIVLFSGVISPLVWTDELASLLFLWLSMLGAVVALRRGEHEPADLLRRRRGGCVVLPACRSRSRSAWRPSAIWR
jgi:hypothetical protein